MKSLNLYEGCGGGSEYLLQYLGCNAVYKYSVLASTAERYSTPDWPVTSRSPIWGPRSLLHLTWSSPQTSCRYVCGWLVAPLILPVAVRSRADRTNLYRYVSKDTDSTGVVCDPDEPPTLYVEIIGPARCQFAMAARSFVFVTSD